MLNRTQADSEDYLRSLRDLAGLLTLPSLWVGRDAETVLQMTTEAIERLVPVEMSYAFAPLWSDKVPLTRLRFNGLTALESEVREWSATISAMDEMPLPSTARVVDTPIGEMRVVRLPMRCGTKGGSTWFGSFQPGFPSDSESILLTAAASLAGSGMQAARLDEERRRSSRAKDEFLAMLGHELRNPLAPIFTALELIKRKGGQPLDGPHAVIERQARHLSNLVDDLLDISRVVTGKVQLTKRPLAIQSILDASFEAARPLMDERAHTVSLKFPDQAAKVYGDFTRLTQVFTNLLTNAAKYTPKHGSIQIIARTVNKTVLVSVKDNGFGISEDLKPRLFHIFEQGETAIDRRNGGLGIGLALVHNFVRLHGGDISVESAGLGKGSTFTVALPLCEHALSTESEDPSPETPLSTARAKIKVLLVDDNADALKLLGEVLRVSGFEVATAAHPHQALALFDSFRPDVAVLDIGLPDMDGYKLARRLKESPHAVASLRLISLSGYGLPEDHRRSALAGIERHLVKPYHPDALIAVLREPPSSL